jgi:hypothetical protein
MMGIRRRRGGSRGEEVRRQRRLGKTEREGERGQKKEIGVHGGVEVADSRWQMRERQMDTRRG